MAAFGSQIGQGRGEPWGIELDKVDSTHLRDERLEVAVSQVDQSSFVHLNLFHLLLLFLHLFRLSGTLRWRYFSRVFSNKGSQRIDVPLTLVLDLFSALLEQLQPEGTEDWRSLGDNRGREQVYVGYPLTPFSEHSSVSWVQSTFAMATCVPVNFSASSSQVGARRLQWPHLRISEQTQLVPSPPTKTYHGAKNLTKWGFPVLAFMALANDSLSSRMGGSARVGERRPRRTARHSTFISSNRDRSYAKIRTRGVPLLE